VRRPVVRARRQAAGPPSSPVSDETFWAAIEGPFCYGPAVGRLEVQLLPVDETILSQLVEVAVSGTHPNEVTPPLSPGDEWTTERIKWLRSYHRDRRAGLGGARREATWAVVADGSVVGAVRLKDTGRAGTLEAGAWLSRSARNRGLGQAALAALLLAAKEQGAAEVTAETTSQNSAAIGVLRRLGFEVRNSEVPEPRVSGRSGGDVVVASRQLASGA
jgi:RimJ/RimL family protein N-acetyltransferase